MCILFNDDSDRFYIIKMRFDFKDQFDPIVEQAAIHNP